MKSKEYIPFTWWTHNFRHGLVNIAIRETDFIFKSMFGQEYYVGRLGKDPDTPLSKDKSRLFSFRTSKVIGSDLSQYLVYSLYRTQLLKGNILI